MGSSPANMNNFGIGQGASPYKQETSENPTEGDNNATTTEKTTKNKINEQGGGAEKADKAWVKALKIGTTLLSGGIQGVYGGKRQYPKINWGKKAQEPTTSPEENVENLITGKKRSGGFGAVSGTTITNTNIQNPDKEKSETT